MVYHPAIISLALATCAYGSIMSNPGSFSAALAARDTPQARETGSPDSGTFVCGTEAPDDEFKALVKEIAKQENSQLQTRDTDGSTASMPQQVAIDTYVNILTNQDETSQQQTRSKVPGLIERLNRDYNTHGFRFDLKGTNITANRLWSEGRGPYHQLRQGNYSTLNIYITDSLDAMCFNGRCPNGHCSMARQFPLDTKRVRYITDGCTIRASQVNNALTATHEIGHWLGLLHTFEGNCTEDGRDPGGDFVFDTPAHIEGGATTTDSNGCPTGTDDSCPLLPGLDPIKNFMNYISPQCQTGLEFTPGQSLRMKSMWNRCREPHRVNATSN